MTKNKVIFAVGGVLIVGLMGCSDKAKERFNDAPRSDVTNDSKADVISMPDGFSNMATKCDHGNRVYVVFHGDSNYGAVGVVPNDPSCAK
jgi:hypothetical protein